MKAYIHAFERHYIVREMHTIYCYKPNLMYPNRTYELDRHYDNTGGIKILFALNGIELLTPLTLSDRP